MNRNIDIYGKIWESMNRLNEINDELNSNTHDVDNLRKINKEAQQKFYVETTSYEITQGVLLNSIPIDYASIDMLISRLPIYKALYEKELNELINSIN